MNQRQPYRSHVILFILLLILLGGSPSTEALERGALGEMRLTDDGRSYFAAWSPDGREILVTRPGEVVESGEGWQTIFDLWLLTADGEAGIKLTGNAAYPLFSLDGEEIAYLSFQGKGKGQVWLLDLDSGERRAIASADWGLPLAWLPDGRLAFARRGRLVLADRQGREELEAVTLAARYQLSPTGERVVSSDGSTLRVEGIGGTDPRTLAHQALVGPAAWSPDGTQLAYIVVGDQLRSQLWVTDADGSVRLLLAESENEQFGAPSWSPDGRTIAFSRCPRGSGTAQACDIWLVGSDGQGLRNLSPGNREESAPVWSPDGRYLAFQRDGDVWLLDVERAEPLAGNQTEQPLPERGSVSLLGSLRESTARAEERLTTTSLGLPAAIHLVPPTTIRVYATGLNYYRPGVPAGRIDAFDFETYVKYVVNCEVPRTWKAEMLKAQGVAARTYGWYYILNNYRLRSYKWDVTDWTSDQCIRPVNFPEVNAAVDATRGQYLWHNNWDDGAPPLDSPIIAMYSANNGDPTRTRSDNPTRFPYLKAVNDPVCFGDTRYGHGWGLSQVGAQRWASWHGWNYQQILTHYYTDVTIEAPAESGPDTKPPIASTILPWTDFYLNSNRVLIVANASDGNSGMKQVDFWARYDDGKGIAWHLLAKDYNESDGWSYLWDLSSLPNQPLTEQSIEIAAIGIDKANNVVQYRSSLGAFVGLDRVAPTGTVGAHQNPNNPSTVTLSFSASDIGGSGLKEMAFSHNWIWEGEDLPHQANSGVKVYDQSALNGYAWRGRAGIHTPGYWYGPYTHQLPPYRPYRAYLRLKCGDVTTAAEVAILDVVDNYGQTLLGLLRLRGIDFREPNVYQEFGVDLNYNYNPSNTPGLEFRTYFTGAADLVLDRVLVVTYPEPYQGTITLDVEEVSDLRVKFIDGAGNVSADSTPIPLNLSNKFYLPLVLKQR